MQNELYINDEDAYVKWGISLEPSGVSVLMTPPPNKDYIENSSRLTHGKVILNTNPKMESRDLTLPIHINAKTTTKFLEYYEDFCTNVLSKGFLKIRTKYQPNVYYRCYYVSCTQFSEFRMEYAAFSLKLVEPDPSNRGENDIHAAT